MSPAACNQKESRTSMAKSQSKTKEDAGAESPSQLIDARIKSLDDWRGKTLAHVLALIKQADPAVLEE